MSAEPDLEPGPIHWGEPLSAEIPMEGIPISIDWGTVYVKTDDGWVPRGQMRAENPYRGVMTNPEAEGHDWAKTYPCEVMFDDAGPCDCGAEVAKTTHAYWCSRMKNDLKE